MFTDDFSKFIWEVLKFASSLSIIKMSETKSSQSVVFCLH